LQSARSPSLFSTGRGCIGRAFATYLGSIPVIQLFPYGNGGCSGPHAGAYGYPYNIRWGEGHQAARAKLVDALAGKMAVLALAVIEATARAA
jgi:hypothetical protein